MKIVKPSATIITEVNGDEILERLERAARTCYKSEDKITANSSRKLITSIIKRGHESVLEHESISVKVVCDRGISHEIVRHRIASYSQESTRYVNYKSSDIEFIKPPNLNQLQFDMWDECMRICEDAYNILIERGCSPQIARSVLPNSLKTELVMTLNLRSWRNFFKLRTAIDAHPQIREIAIPLLQKFQSIIPIIFDDIGGTK
jgi:thymidylate synthase (FAD)